LFHHLRGGGSKKGKNFRSLPNTPEQYTPARNHHIQDRQKGRVTTKGKPGLGQESPEKKRTIKNVGLKKPLVPRGAGEFTREVGVLSVSATQVKKRRKKLGERPRRLTKRTTTGKIKAGLVGSGRRAKLARPGTKAQGKGNLRTKSRPTEKKPGVLPRKQ